MGFTPSLLRFLILQHKRVHFGGSVITLGNQDVWATYDELKSYFENLKCPYKTPKKINYHTSEFLKNSKVKGAESFVHARTFFEMMGLTEYFDIDKFDQDKPVLLHDMNTSIPSELRNRFSLFIDAGSMEHIFDIKQVVFNIVQMIQQNGWVIHISPSSNTIDGGFYSMSPCFFYDFYEANGFSNFACYLIQLNPKNYADKCPYFEYTYGMAMGDLIDPKRQVHTCFMARKERSHSTLTVPTQGKYSGKKIGTTGPSLFESRLHPALKLYLRPLRPLLRFLISQATCAWRKFVPRYKKLEKW